MPALVGMHAPLMMGLLGYVHDRGQMEMEASTRQCSLSKPSFGFKLVVIVISRDRLTPL